MYNSIKFFLKTSYTDPRRISITCALTAVFILFQIADTHSQTTLGNNDGPYFFYENGGTKLVRVENGDIRSEVPVNSSFKVMTEDGEHQFEIKLHPHNTPSWNSPKSNKDRKSVV